MHSCAIWWKSTFCITEIRSKSLQSCYAIFCQRTVNKTLQRILPRQIESCHSNRQVCTWKLTYMLSTAPTLSFFEMDVEKQIKFKNSNCPLQWELILESQFCLGTLGLKISIGGADIFGTKHNWQNFNTWLSKSMIFSVFQNGCVRPLGDRVQTSSLKCTHFQKPLCLEKLCASNPASL